MLGTVNLTDAIAYLTEGAVRMQILEQIGFIWSLIVEIGR